jgi:hypothetical protein
VLDGKAKQQPLQQRRMTETSRPVDERGDNILDSKGKAVCSLRLFHGKTPTSVQGLPTWYQKVYRKTSFY